MLNKEDRNYFNDLIEDIIELFNELGILVEEYNIDVNYSIIEYCIKGKFFKKPTNSDDFVTLTKRAILKSFKSKQDTDIKEDNKNYI